MICRCCYCFKILQEEDGNYPVGEVSDGICPDCYKEEQAKIDAELKGYGL